MPPGALSKSSPDNLSLTDRVLNLCMSGHFGVREAIAIATRQQHTQGNRPSNALPRDQAARKLFARHRVV